MVPPKVGSGIIGHKSYQAMLPLEPSLRGSVKWWYRQYPKN